MSIDREMLSALTFQNVYRDLARDGQIVQPRGLKVRELENYGYTLPPYVRFANFDARKLNVNYIRREFLWYLRGERFDRTIVLYAKLWKDMVADDGAINSNYGQYIFGKTLSQFDYVVQQLAQDSDSRRASIVILNSDHLRLVSKDTPCTYALNFRIREGRLNMTVHMRSQDAIYGMGSDAPCFSFIHEMITVALQEHYPNLKYGDYYHFVDSFHVYERHFKMLEALADHDPYSLVECPKISGPSEVRFLIHGQFEDGDRTPEEYKFTRWLWEVYDTDTDEEERK